LKAEKGHSPKKKYQGGAIANEILKEEVKVTAEV
jgi:hypothetical protein